MLFYINNLHVDVSPQETSSSTTAAVHVAFVPIAIVCVCPKVSSMIHASPAEDFLPFPFLRKFSWY
jgi:hypothetical protein